MRFVPEKNAMQYCKENRPRDPHLAPLQTLAIVAFHEIKITPSLARCDCIFSLLLTS